MQEESFGIKLQPGLIIRRESEYHRNVTEKIQGIVNGWGMKDGYIHVLVEHTTCTLLLQEDEPCLIRDLLDRLDIAAPISDIRSVEDLKDRLYSTWGSHYRNICKLSYYEHDDLTVRTENLEEGTEERQNGHAHVRASLIGQNPLILRVRDGKLALGKWQQVLFLDFDDLQERRERTITVSMMGS